jgi:hypothetical protein
MAVIIAGAAAATTCIAATEGICAEFAGTLLTTGAFSGLTGSAVLQRLRPTDDASRLRRSICIRRAGVIGAVACALSVGTACATALGGAALTESLVG